MTAAAADRSVGTVHAPSTHASHTRAHTHTHAAAFQVRVCGNTPSCGNTAVTEGDLALSSSVGCCSGHYASGTIPGTASAVLSVPPQGVGTAHVPANSGSPLTVGTATALNLVSARLNPSRTPTPAQAPLRNGHAHVSSAHHEAWTRDHSFTAECPIMYYSTASAVLSVPSQTRHVGTAHVPANSGDG
jgi:hypothetical protein